jgi:hypothetical protein
VAANIKDKLYPIRIRHFAGIIPISEQRVIKDYKKYVFNSFHDVQYRGKDAVQVYFYNRKSSKQTGYMIILKENKAIVALQHSIQSINSQIISKFEGKMRYTDLDLYKVEVNYELNDDNLYEFDSGLYHAQYTNRWGKNTKSIIFKSHLKRTMPFKIEEGTEKPINHLFY